jgi:uncharacterized protein (DUF433 family)
MKIANGIEVKKEVRFGKPVIEGTRVPVETIIAKLAGGMDIQRIMSEYDLTHEQVLDALEYAANILANEKIRAVG